MQHHFTGGDRFLGSPVRDIPLAAMPLLWFSLSFIAGILFASYTAIPQMFWWWLSLMITGMLLAVHAAGQLLRGRPKLFSSGLSHTLQRLEACLSRPLARTTRSVRFFLMLLAVFALGGARLRATQAAFTPASLAWYNDRDRDWVVVGVVQQPPDRRDTYTHLHLAVETIRPESEIRHTNVEGRLLARLPADQVWQYGDRVLVRGALLTPPQNPEFSYRDYLARQGVYTYMPFAEASLVESGAGNPLRGAIYSFREHALYALYRIFSDPEASLLAGILLGDESGISTEVSEAFTLTGAAHIIVISGFNITILAGLFIRLFSPRLGAGRGALLAGVLVSLYVLLVGADPPVVRAAILGWLGLLAGFLGRRQAGLNSLALAAALMAAFVPSLLWDVSFQLSFSATFGLVLFAEPLERGLLHLLSLRLPERMAVRVVRPASDYLLFTAAATLTTLPVILYHFHRLAIISLPVNLLILPAQPAVMVLGGLAVLSAMIWLPLGMLLANAAWPFAAYTIRVVEWFAALPGGTLVVGELGGLPILAFYVLLILTALRPAWWLVRREWFRPMYAYTALVVLLVLVWNRAAAVPDGNLHVTFLDVAGGEAVLLETPGGRLVLIGGGEHISMLSDAIGRHAPLFSRNIDVLVIASPLEQATAALPRLVERYPPEQVIWAGPVNASYSSRRLSEGLAQASIPIIPAEPGQRLDLGHGADLQVLAVNRRGALLLVQWDRFRLLLPMALGFDELEAFAYGRAIGPVTVLYLAAGGYAPLNPPEWVDNLSPRLVVLSVSAGNPQGLPSPETLQTLHARSLLRTDRHGWIRVSSDGRGFWVQTERQEP